MEIGKKLRGILGEESSRFFKNCGQVEIEGRAYDSSLAFLAAIKVHDTITPQAARKILEDMASLNVVLETLNQGNQYDPDKLRGKCPRMYIRPDGEGGVDTGTKWW